MKNLPKNPNETSDEEEQESGDEKEDNFGEQEDEEEEEEEEEEEVALSDLSVNDAEVEDIDSSHAEEEVKALPPALASVNQKLIAKKPTAEPKSVLIALLTQKGPLDAAKAPPLSGVLVPKSNGSVAAAGKLRRITTQQMVDTALRTLNERSGSSLVAIKKYIMSNYADLDANRTLTLIKKYIKVSLGSGKLVQTKGAGMNGSFKLSPEVTKRELMQKKMKAKKLKEQDKKEKTKEKAKTKAEANTKADAKTKKKPAPKSTARISDAIIKGKTSKKETKVNPVDSLTTANQIAATAGAKKREPPNTKEKSAAKAELPAKKAGKKEAAKEIGKKSKAKTATGTATKASTKPPKRKAPRISLGTLVKPPLKRSTKKTALTVKDTAAINKGKSEELVAAAGAGDDDIQVATSGSKKQKLSKK